MIRITAVLEAPVVSYSGLHLDGILAYAAVERETAGAFYPQTPDYIPVDLPLRCAWRSGQGVPLWCSTDLLPDGGHAGGVLYLHRRALETHMTRSAVRTGRGRDRELRSPLPVVSTTHLVAYADGDAGAIAELLSAVSSIGKKRIVTGAVREWLVEELPDEFSFVRDDCALRPLPHGYLYGEEHNRNAFAEMIAFSPPYWHVKTRSWCVPTGALV